MSRYLIFDESGNLGAKGRYYVISCIDTANYKPLYNIMQKKILQARKQFPDLGALHTHEIKAKDAYPCVKYHMAECIAKKNISISYIVADLKHVKPSLLHEQNIFYNFLMKLLVETIITKNDNDINIIYDNHTTKVGSVNSMEEYLKLSFIYEKNLDLSMTFKSMDSNGKNAYHVQAADYVANALYSHYEYNFDDYYKIYRPLVANKLLFPLGKFGL